jgi:hypothetical protein
LLPSAAGCASQVPLAPRAAYFYFARPHKFELQTRQALLRPWEKETQKNANTVFYSSRPGMEVERSWLR